MACLELFWTFFRIGLFTFGGGYAMISLIRSTCVEQKGWITDDDMMNITVIAETTPGPVAINCATFTGYKRAGFWGAVSATLGVILPSFIIIYLISLFLDRFLEIRWVEYAFRSIQVGVSILILQAGIGMSKQLPKNLLSKILLFGSLGAMLLITFFSLNISSIALMVLCAVVSFCVFAAKKGGGKV